MAVTLKQYIIIESDNPLEARLSERPTKAYMVANLAFIDGAEASATHYHISLASVYAAMSFYEENRAAIEKELANVEKQIRENGIDANDAIAKFKKEMQDKQ